VLCRRPLRAKMQPGLAVLERSSGSDLGTAGSTRVTGAVSSDVSSARAPASDRRSACAGAAVERSHPPSPPGPEPRELQGDVDDPMHGGVSRPQRRSDSRISSCWAFFRRDGNRFEQSPSDRSNRERMAIFADLLMSGTSDCAGLITSVDSGSALSSAGRNVGARLRVGASSSDS